MKALITCCAVLSVMVVFIGCGASPIPSTVETKPAVKSGEGLMEEWNQLAKSDYEHVNFDRAMIIANELALQGSNGLDPFFKVIEDPKETDIAKMLAVVSLSPHVNDTHAERLMPLTENKYDSITRGCAVHLLGNCIEPTPFFRVRELAHDADPHVSKVAAMVMLRKGDMEVLPKILEIWNAPDTSPKDKQEVVMGIPQALAGKHITFFTEALCDERIDVAGRSRAAKMLGDVAGPDVIPALKDCQGKTTDSGLIELMNEAVAKIEERGAAAAAPVQLQMPNGVGLVLKPKPAESSDTAVESQPPSQPETEAAP